MTSSPSFLRKATAQEVAPAPLLSAAECIYRIDNKEDSEKSSVQIFGQIQSRLAASSNPLCIILFGTDHNSNSSTNGQTSPPSHLKKKNSSQPNTKDSPWYTVGAAGFPSIGLLNHVYQGKEKTLPRRINPYPIPKRIDFAHLEGEGIGYKEGYSKIGMMIGPSTKLGTSSPFWI